MFLISIKAFLGLLAIPLFMIISIKYGWSKTLWTVLEGKFYIRHKNVVYILAFIIFDAIMIALCIFIGIDYRFLNSILIGLGFALMPPLAEIPK